MTIDQFFRENPRAAVALSGGVDSAWLLHEAVRCCEKTAAYYVRSPFQQTGEMEDAVQTAEFLGAELHILDVDALSDPRVAANPANRCYFCKQNIFTAICAAAAADGFPVIMDGSNASDDAGDRPGMAALRELGVRSPLRECGITKAEIRRMTHEAGMKVWDKPSCACLATRVPTGTPITREDLLRVDRGESTVRSMGFVDFRLRLRGENGLLQVSEDQHAQAARALKKINAALAGDFARVELDPKPRPRRET